MEHSGRRLLSRVVGFGVRSLRASVNRLLVGAILASLALVSCSSGNIASEGLDQRDSLYLAAFELACEDYGCGSAVALRLIASERGAEDGLRDRSPDIDIADSVTAILSERHIDTVYSFGWIEEWGDSRVVRVIQTRLNDSNGEETVTLLYGLRFIEGAWVQGDVVHITSSS